MRGPDYLLLVTLFFVVVWVAHIWRKAVLDNEEARRRTHLQAEGDAAGEGIRISDTVAPPPVTELPAPADDLATVVERLDAYPAQRDLSERPTASAIPDLAPDLAELRKEIAALAARAGQTDDSRLGRIQPELASLRSEVAQLAAMVAQSQREADTERVTPQLDALRAELAALSDRIQEASSAALTAPRASAAPQATTSTSSRGWPGVLRPLAALGFGLFAIGTLSIVAMLPDLWSKMHGPSAPSIVAPLPPIQAGPGTTDIRRETAAPVTLARPSAVPDAVASGGMRVALVIGNGGYRNVSRLPNPPRDADAVASSLRRAGFQTVMRQLDLTRERMNDVLREFAAVAEKADWAVIYFAGHGMEIGGTNYLIPIDAKLSFDRDVPFEAIPMDNVMSAVAGAKRLRLVLLDSCRDNPFVNQMSRTVAGRSIGRGLAQIEPEAGTLVVFAAKHGQIALDGERQNSPFASALVKRVLTPGLEVRRLFDHVRDDVLELTGRRQQPFSYGSLPGREDFFFVARR